MAIGEISGQYRYTGKGPVDSKQLVKTYADLLDQSTWLSDKGSKTAFNGLFTAVWLNTEDVTKNGLYLLMDPECTTTLKHPDVTNEKNWHKLCSIEDLVGINANIDAIVSTIGSVEEGTTLVDLITAVEEKIPTSNSDIENGAGYQTEEQVLAAIENAVVELNLAQYAKTEQVTAALSSKADKTALEELQQTVENFLTGTGATDALDSLQELIEYINTHDDVELADIIADVEALQTKVDTGDQKVSEYVTAAIEALATQLAAKADADKVVSNETFEQFKTTNSERIDSVAEVANAAAVKTEVSDALELEKQTRQQEIASALAEAKKYADDNDSDTIYDDTALTNRVNDLESVTSDHETRLDKVEVFFETTEEETLDAALDTLIEIQKYINEDGEVAKQVLSNTRAIETLNGDASTEGSVDKKIADAIVPFATVEFVNDVKAIAEAAQTSEEVAASIETEFTKANLSQYAKATDVTASLETKADKTAIPTKVSQLENDKEYLTEHQDLSEYAKSADVAEKTHKHVLADVTDYESPDLSVYALKTELPSLEGYAKIEDTPTVELSVSEDETGNLILL